MGPAPTHDVPRFAAEIVHQERLQNKLNQARTHLMQMSEHTFEMLVMQLQFT